MNKSKMWLLTRIKNIRKKFIYYFIHLFISLNVFVALKSSNTWPLPKRREKKSKLTNAFHWWENINGLRNDTTTLIETVPPFARLKKVRVLLRRELWSWCSKNQLESSKPNPIFFRYENIVNIRTWYSINHLPELIASAAKNNIDIICVQEHRYFQKELKHDNTGKGWTFNSAFAITPSMTSLNSIVITHPRIMSAAFNVNHWSTSVFSYNSFNAVMNRISQLLRQTTFSCSTHS